DGPCASGLRVARLLLPGVEPPVARGARVREQRLEHLRIPALEQAADARELAAVAVELREQRLAVREADVGPHARMARRDAREIAEAPGREGEQPLRARVPGDLVQQSVGEHMRKMADRGEDRVV